MASAGSFEGHPSTIIKKPLNDVMIQTIDYGEPELTTVTRFFIEWTGIEEIRCIYDKNDPKSTFTIRKPWTVKRLRNGHAFSCSCSDFKSKCTRDTFVNQEKTIVFSKSE